MEETEPSVTKVDAMLQTENSDQLHLQINEIRNKYTFLVKTSEQKDDLIKLLIKEKNILDGEKILLQKEHQSAVKDKEIIVMRFAIVEKNLLDAKNHIEQLEKKEKKNLKETEALNSRIKILKDEKQNVNTLLEIKCQEQKNTIRDIDLLKNQISSLETKCKWNSVKLKQEMDIKQANQITLKHINSEQVDKICCLEKQLEDACNEIASVKAQLAVFQEKVTCIESENKKLKETIFELQILLDDHMLKVADLQSKSSELEACRAAFSIEQSTNKEYAFTIERLNKLADGHSKDIEILRQNESELLALNEKLSFSNVILQNEISLYQSKSLAIAIENDSVKKSQVEYEGNVQRLVDKINLDRKNLAEERLTVATHVTEKNRECEMLKKQLEQALGDLDAVRKKNSLIVKDLQREISTLKKKFKTEADSSEIERSPSKDNLEPIYDSQTEQEKQCFEALHTGVLQTIYGQNKISEMNFDLVLEVNKKLQGVLEETLLKNITLKENIDTLGLEIDRLTRQLSSLKKEKR